MKHKAAKGRKLLSLAAVCVLAALGAALPAEASRYLPPLTPDLAPAPPVLEAAPQPARSLGLFTDDDVLVLTACSELDEKEVDQLLRHRGFRPFTSPLASVLERVWSPKNASRGFSRLGDHIPLEAGDLERILHQGVYFAQPDPLGPVDSPNLYQAFGFDAFNVTDPWGTAECLDLWNEGCREKWAADWGDYAADVQTWSAEGRQNWRLFLDRKEGEWRRFRAKAREVGPVLREAGNQLLRKEEYRVGWEEMWDTSLPMEDRKRGEWLIVACAVEQACMVVDIALGFGEITAVRPGPAGWIDDAERTTDLRRVIAAESELTAGETGQVARQIREHHTIPKYAGGRENQELAGLFDDVHDAYHEFLDNWALPEGMTPRSPAPRSFGGQVRPWGRENAGLRIFAAESAENRRFIVENLRRTYQETGLYDDVAEVFEREAKVFIAGVE